MDDFKHLAVLIVVGFAVSVVFHLAGMAWRAAGLPQPQPHVWHKGQARRVTILIAVGAILAGSALWAVGARL